MDPNHAAPGQPHPAASTIYMGEPVADPLTDDSSDRDLLLDSEEEDGVSRPRSSQWDRHVDIASLGTVQPQPWHRDLIAIRHKFIRQVLGLNPFRTSYFALYRPLKDWQSRAILGMGLVLAMAAGLPLPIIGVILGKIINNFPPPEQELELRLVQLMAVAVAYFAVTWGWSVCWGVIGERVSRKTRENLVERALGMDMAFFDTTAPDMTSILTEKTQIIQLGTSEKVGIFIASISYFVAAFSVGFLLNPRLTAVMFVTVIPTMTLIVFCGTKQVSKYSKQASAFTEQATAVAESAFRAVQVVQAFGVSEKLAESHMKYLRSALRAGIRKSIVGALMLGSVYFTAYAANALAFWYGNRLRNAEAEAGTIYAVVFLILDASFVVGSFGPFIQTFALAAAAGQSVFAILDHPKSDIDVYSTEGQPAEKSHFGADIRLQRISFVYPARPTVRVLDELSLHFEAGKVTGVVGPSGSGKSTIAALLLRLYDPSVGQIMLGEEDLKSFNISSLRSRIALVTQHPVLFTGTILENIKHGLPQDEYLSEEEILARCTAAAADAHCDFLNDLPNGIHTRVGTGHHSQLSGGQKQRITLARALVGNPSLLLLDEYTSAMDAGSESIVLENLKRSSLASSRTTIIIAHRLATVKDADRIVVLKEGSVVEDGQHEDLVRQNGVYADLVKAQQFEKKHSFSGASSVMSSNQSSHKENGYIVTGGAERNGTNDGPATSGQPNKNAFELIRRCLSLNRKEVPAIVVGIVSSMASGSVIIGEALIFGNLVELLNDTSNSPQMNSKVAFYCLMFFILAIVAVASHASGGTAFGIVSENLVVRVRDVSFRTILSQDLAWFSKNPHHALMAKLSMDSSSLSGLSGVILGTFFSISTSVLGGIILAHIMAWKIAIVLLCAVPVMLCAGFFRLRILAKAEERHQTAYNGAAALASEACAAIQTVAALGREKDVLQLYREAVQKPYEESLRFTVLGNIMLAFSLSVTYFVYALAYWWGSKQVRSGNYGQREFFVVLPALLFSAQAAGQLFSLAPEITRAKTGAQSVFALHDERPSIITPPSTSPTLVATQGASSNEPPAISNHGQLEFRGVSLRYETRPEVPALNNVSFLIKPGEFVAFVGRSGAGKSSTVHLIERFFDPTAGHVLLDNRDISKAPVKEHRARLALVEQEPDLFPGSIMFNIGLGAKPGAEASDDDIMRVAKQCELHEFIMSLPNGYNEHIGSHGAKLSGGQRQRLAIARALIRDPEILLLDEATSQLDATTERDIRKAIAAASRGRTTIMIAHRLASVQHADRIFVFDAGRIIEQGRHDELVASWGIYSAMVAAQELE